MKILIIQTAFIGDVILATSLANLVKTSFPKSQVDFLLRKGNEGLLKNHPSIDNIIIWDKKKGKYRNLISLALKARKVKYDHVLNIQRFASSGIFMALCGAKNKIGFDKNPLSFIFNKKIKHKIPYQIEDGFLHEVQRNALLLEPIIEHFSLPKAKDIPPTLAISNEDQQKAASFSKENYLVLAPSSVWFTKQWQKSKWIELKEKLQQEYQLLFIGGPDDKEYIDSIIGETENCINLCGKLNLIQSAALMKNAKRVFVNDSAPLHLASSVQAKTTAIFCSTVTDFGYTPLSKDSTVIQLTPRLECMPCGLHGKKQCPLGHFNCSAMIEVQKIIETI